MAKYILKKVIDIFASERYYQLTQKRYVYNIMPIENIPSVLTHGIVCYDYMCDIEHSSVAMNEIQERRNKVDIPNGLSLHKYANLYFTYNNPMLFKRQDDAEILCVLALSSKVLDLEGCVVSDRNASVSLARFYSPVEGMEELDFEKIHAQYWNSEDPFEKRRNKAIKCAEILVPYCIPSDYIVGAYVVNEESRELLISKGFNKRIEVRASVFYR